MRVTLAVSMHRRRFLASAVGLSSLAGCIQTTPWDGSQDTNDTTADDDTAAPDDESRSDEPSSSDDDSPTDGSPEPSEIDSDLDWLQDEWEIAGEAPNGLPLPDCDPDHRDLYLDIVSLDGARIVPDGHVEFIVDEFASMPVMNPDGTEGINVHVHGPREIDLGIEELRDLEGNNRPRIGPVHAWTLYSPDVMEERRGIYHLLGVMPDSTYIEGKGGFATYKMAMVKRMDREMMIHQLLHTIVGADFGAECLGPDHTCGGYLTRPPGLYFADETVEWLQNNQYDHVDYSFGG